MLLTRQQLAMSLVQLVQDDYELLNDMIIDYLSRLDDKDIDGLHPMNLGHLLQGQPNFIPCTPFGCIQIMKHYKIQVKSKNIVIIGRSNLVGKPLYALLSQKFNICNATVTLCHSYTNNISQFTKNADIIIVATGMPNLLKTNMIKKDCVIIDVGINRINS